MAVPLLRSTIARRTLAAIDRAYRGWPRASTRIDRLSHLQSYGIVHGLSQRLLRPQVPLRRLDRGMAEEQLDLFQLPARLAAQFGAGPAQVVRRELAQMRGLGITHHQAPDCLFVPDLGSHDDIALVHGPEDAANQFGKVPEASSGVGPN